MIPAAIGGVHYFVNGSAPSQAVPAQPTDTVSPPIPSVAPPHAAPVTIAWWHVYSVERQRVYWQELADEYMTAHPHVTIDITVPEGEPYKTRLSAAIQAGDPPDLFQSWGGHTMKEYAKAGLLKDITGRLDADEGAWRNTFGRGALGVYSFGGRNYGVPWDVGMVGFWYNKTLFAQAGIHAPPATWTEFLEDTDLLKAAGIIPIAIGEGDGWPGGFWYGYLAARIGGRDAFDAAYGRTGSFADPPFVEAGGEILRLLSHSPFNRDFLTATFVDELTLMADGRAAMELTGQWAPLAGRDYSADPQRFDETLGWFPFPTVEGGAGDSDDAFGGTGGFVVGKDAPAETIDFLKYLTRVEAQIRCAQEGLCLPAVVGGEAGLRNPLMIAVQQTLFKAKYLQLYYDVFLPPATEEVVLECVRDIFSGTLTPEQAARAIEESAEQELG